MVCRLCAGEDIYARSNNNNSILPRVFKIIIIIIIIITATVVIEGEEDYDGDGRFKTCLFQISFPFNSDISC